MLSTRVFHGILNPDIKKIIPIAPYEMVYLHINTPSSRLPYWDSMTPPRLPTLGNSQASSTAIPIPITCHCESKNLSTTTVHLSAVGRRRPAASLSILASISLQTQHTRRPNCGESRCGIVVVFKRNRDGPSEWQNARWRDWRTKGLTRLKARKSDGNGSHNSIFRVDSYTSQ